MHFKCRARQINYRRSCPVGNQTLKYSCPVLNLVARDFSQILKYKNIKYVSIKVPGLVQKIVPFESFSVLSKLKKND